MQDASEIAAHLLIPGDVIRRGHRVYEVHYVANTPGAPVEVRAYQRNERNQSAASSQTMLFPPDEIIRRVLL